MSYLLFAIDEIGVQLVRSWRAFCPFCMKDSSSGAVV